MTRGAAIAAPPSGYVTAKKSLKHAGRYELWHTGTNNLVEETAGETYRTPAEAKRDYAARRHRKTVADAIAAGKPVPAHVLSDYQGLSPAAPAVVQEERQEGGGSKEPRKPWEMTKAEFDSAGAADVDEPLRDLSPAVEKAALAAIRRRGIRAKSLAHAQEVMRYRLPEWRSAIHRAQVSVAIKANRAVPESVLADYPDLKPTTPVQAPPAAQEVLVGESDGDFYRRRVAEEKQGSEINDYTAVARAIGSVLERSGVEPSPEYASRPQPLMWELTSNFHNPLVSYPADMPLDKIIEGMEIASRQREGHVPHVLSELRREGGLLASSYNKSPEQLIQAIEADRRGGKYTITNTIEEARRDSGHLRRRAKILEALLKKETPTTAAIKKLADDIDAAVVAKEDRLQQLYDDSKEEIAERPKKLASELKPLDPAGSRVTDAWDGNVAASGSRYLSDGVVIVDGPAVSEKDRKQLTAKQQTNKDGKPRSVKQSAVKEHWDAYTGKGRVATPAGVLTHDRKGYFYVESGGRLYAYPAQQVAYLARISKADGFRVAPVTDEMNGLVLTRDGSPVVIIAAEYSGAPQLDIATAKKSQGFAPPAKNGRKTKAARQAADVAEAQGVAEQKPPILSVAVRKPNGRKPLSRSAVARTFPGARITSTPSGWRVEVGQSYIDIENTQEIVIDWDAAERGLGRSIPQSMRKNFVAPGQFTLKLPDGTRHDGLGVIRLAEGMADDATLRHEALHLARRAGLLTEPEWQALKKEYGRPDANDDMNEELVAEKREAWTGAKTVWERIQSWLRRLLAAIGITPRQARDVMQLMDEGSFWQRTGSQPGGVAYSLESRPMSPALRKEVDERIAIMRGDSDFMADNEGISQRDMEMTALQDIVEMGDDYGGHLNHPEAAGERRAWKKVHVEATKLLGDDSSYSIKGRPDLANPVDAPAGSPERELVDTVDEMRNQAGEPAVRSGEDVQAEAQERLKDYDAERRRLLDVARQGGQLSDTDTVVAKTIVSREAAAAVASGDQAKIRETMDLIDAYRRTGAEQGRAFRQRRDPVETPAERMRRHIVEAILEPPRKTREKIERAERDGDAATAKKLRDEWAKEFDALKAKLLELGVDLDNLNELGYSKIKAAQAISTIAAAKASVWDKAYEYWRNAILSSPRTQSANAIGNFGHAAWHFTGERLTEAVANTILGRREGAQLGELPHLVGGLLPGLSRGARNFLLTWQTELPQFDEQLNRVGQFKYESANVAIQGKLGRTVRIPQRLLLAVDDFARTLFANLEVGAQAYRIAKSEGKADEALRERIAELTADIESPAWSSSYDISQELAFQQRGAPVSQKIKQHLLAARRDLPGLRYVIPFVTTPLNIFETGLRKTPLGSLELGYKMYQNIKAGKPPTQGITGQAAQQMLAWAVVLALFGNNEDDPWITGSEAEHQHGTRELSRRTFPSQSIKIGETWYSYGRLEPFATALGLMTDWTMAAKSGDAGRMVKTPFTSVVGQMKDKTFLSGVGDILTALEAENTEEKAGRWASNFAVSWVPNLVRTGGRSLNEEIPQRGVWGKGSDWWAMLFKRTLQKTEVVPGIPEVPMYDLWGRTIPTTQSPIPSTDFLYRLTSPVDTKQEDIFVGDRLLIAYNNQNPDDARYPGAIRRSYSVNGKTTYMTDEQFADYSRVSGLVAAKLVEADDWNFDAPTTEDMDKLESLILEGRSAARDALVAKWTKGVEFDDSEKGVALLAASRALRTLGQPRPQSLPKDEREKGVTFSDYMAQFNARIENAKKFLAKEGIESEDALSQFDKLTAGLERDNRLRQRRILGDRIAN